MKCTCLLLSVFLCQDPEPSGRDLIVLRDGGELEGRIVLDTSGYIEIELGEGTVVGFEKKRVESIRRGGEGPGEPDATPRLRPRDQWYALHDADGRPVGSLHATVAVDADRRLRLGEEWRFRGPRGPTEITVLEVVTEDLEPVSCFYHERSRNRAEDRILHERLVRGVVRGTELTVERRTLLERSRCTYRFGPDACFPLLAREGLRKRHRRDRRARSRVIYDPATERLVRRSFVVGPQRWIEQRGERIAVRELVVEDAETRSSEWVDASARIVRREINGPGLIAIPTSAELAEHYAVSREAPFEPSRRAELAEQFALWLPGPAWEFVETNAPGRITARAPGCGASASLVHLDHLAPDLRPGSAADAVHRWLALAKDEFEVEQRSASRLRDRATVCLLASWTERRGRTRVRFRGELHVLEVRGRHLALCLAAPDEHFQRLRGDFERIKRTLELYAEAVAPPPRGLLLGGR